MLKNAWQVLQGMYLCNNAILFFKSSGISHSLPNTMKLTNIAFSLILRKFLGGLGPFLGLLCIKNLLPSCFNVCLCYDANLIKKSGGFHRFLWIFQISYFLGFGGKFRVFQVFFWGLPQKKNCTKDDDRYFYKPFQSKNWVE